MKHLSRLLLLVIALAVGGLLGYFLLPDFEIGKMIIFGAMCFVLGEILYQVDKKIQKNNFGGMICHEGNNYCLFFVSRINRCVCYECSFFYGEGLLV